MAEPAPQLQLLDLTQPESTQPESRSGPRYYARSLLAEPLDDRQAAEPARMVHVPVFARTVLSIPALLAFGWLVLALLTVRP